MAKASTTKKQKVETTTQEKCDTALSKLDGLETKSAKIRALSAEGFTRSEIAKSLGIKYQHVRNVLITPLKREQETE